MESIVALQATEEQSVSNVPKLIRKADFIIFLRSAGVLQSIQRIWAKSNKKVSDFLKTQRGTVKLPLSADQCSA